MGVIVLIIAAWLWIKLVFMLVGKLRSYMLKKENNPYINAQKIINQNDKHYDEYIQWMCKNNGGIPLDKMKTAEEVRADNQLKKSLNL
ncbi:hypothetical protein OX284_014580 [Flavobacterium sp. SUN046]|uniref:hypothetical protein n=1 Tax=Flavobacterium sp. SUN046 TaxID=3002440 RepID=UPI002DBF67C3|nr:hypothetical protein [Flavobacterium sp. SUN046]MEC4050662.1 hypothetical protein [Flavobacterium sp. SUN046]